MVMRIYLPSKEGGNNVHFQTINSVLHCEKHIDNVADNTRVVAAFKTVRVLPNHVRG